MPAPVAIAHGHRAHVQTIESEILQATRLADSCRREGLHGGPIHRLDLAAGVEQDHRIRQRFQRGFKCVLGSDDFADVRAAKLGQVVRHLVESGCQLAELVMRRDVDALVEVSLADRIGAACQLTDRSDDGAGQVPGHEDGDPERDRA